MLGQSAHDREDVEHEQKQVHWRLGRIIRGQIGWNPRQIYDLIWVVAERKNNVNKDIDNKNKDNCNYSYSFLP